MLAFISEKNHPRDHHTQLSQLFLHRGLQRLPPSSQPRSGDHFLECWKCPWRLCPAGMMLVEMEKILAEDDRDLGEGRSQAQVRHPPPSTVPRPRHAGTQSRLAWRC